MNLKKNSTFSELNNLNFFLEFLYFALIPLYQKFLLIFYPIFLVKILKFKLVKKPFTRFQVYYLLLITYISLHDYYFSRISFESILVVTPFILLFIFSFLSYDLSALKKIKNLLYTVFYFNFFANISQILINNNFKGDEINYFSSFYHSLGGIYGHPYLSATLSVITFAFAYLFHDKKMLIVSILSLFVSSSLRSILFLFPIFVAYYFLRQRFRLYQILSIIFFGTFLVFILVKFDSNYEPYKRCSLDIHTQKYYQCKGYNSSALRFYAWKTFSENFSSFYIYGNEEKKVQYKSQAIGNYLDPEKIYILKIFESPYLQFIADYGLGFFIIFSCMLINLTAVNYKKYILSGSSADHKRKYIFNFSICCLTIFDCFYGTFFFCSLTWLTIFPLIASERR
jgi:hypothetical protein